MLCGEFKCVYLVDGGCDQLGTECIGDMCGEYGECLGCQQQDQGECDGLQK